LEKAATEERAFVSRPRTVRIPEIDALYLGLGNGYDHGSDTGSRQEQAGKQPRFS
jgi:hypothetical protein